MSNLPRDVRIQTLHDVGVKIDDGLEAAKIQTARWESARTALTGAVNDIIKGSTDSKLDSSTVMHCVKIVQGLVIQASANYYTSLGAEKQIESHVAIIKKLYDLEVVLKRREEMPPTPEELAVERRPPARTIKEQRLAAAAAEAAVIAPADLKKVEENHEDKPTAESPVVEAVKQEEIPPNDAPIAAPPMTEESVRESARGKRKKKNAELKAKVSEEPVEIVIDTSELEEQNLPRKRNRKK